MNLPSSACILGSHLETDGGHVSNVPDQCFSSSRLGAAYGLDKGAGSGGGCFRGDVTPVSPGRRK